MGVASVSTIQPYAQVVPSKKFAKDASDKQGGDALKKFCLIAMWKFKDDQWKCYRMFKVEDPAFLEVDFTDDRTQRQFIQVSEHKELFFFTKERKSYGTVSHVGHILDTRMAMKCAESELERKTATYFKPPIKKKIIIEKSSQCYGMLDRFFHPEDRILARTNMRLYDFNDKKYLALTLRYTSDEFGHLMPTQHSNIHIVDLVQKQTLFTIYEAELLLDISLTAETGRPDQVTFLSSANDIVKIEWDNFIHNVDQTALNGNPLKQQVFETIPNIDEVNFLDKKDQQKETLADYLKITRFLSGCIHKSGSRATICYQDCALITYDLQKAQPPTNMSMWCGHMGRDDDFVIENMALDTATKKIVGNGMTNKDEKLEVSGNFNYLSKWYCEIERDGQMSDLNFERFTIDEMSGKVVGWGDFQGQAFVINNGGRSNNLVSFRLDFAGDTSLMFTGSMNEAKSEIEGKFSINN